MGFTEWLLVIVGGFAATILAALLNRNEKLGELVGQIKTLERENAELRQKLKEEDEKRTHALRQLEAYYDQRVDGEQKKIEDIKLSHETWRQIAHYCINALNRLNPGWLDDRIAGKPEYELVFTEPNKLKGAALVKSQMRPPPRPKNPSGAVSPTPPDKT